MQVLRNVMLTALTSGLVLAIASPAWAQGAETRFAQSLKAVSFEPAAGKAEWAPKTLNVDANDVRFGEAPVVRQNRAQGIGFGVLAGLQRSTVDIEEDGFEDSESGNGLMLGAWVGGNKGGRIGFTGEFIYITRKFDIEDQDGDGDEEEFKTNLFSIPAVFHVNFGRGGAGDPRGYVIAGPVFTFLLSQKANGEDLGDDEPFKGADIGVLFGGGVEIFRLGFEVRYNMGLRNISSQGDTEDIKTRQLEFVVKFRFSGA